MLKKPDALISSPTIWYASWLVSVLGYVLAGLMFHFPSGFPPNNGTSWNPSAFFVGAIFGALTGAVVGSLQGLLLRRYFTGVGRWVAVSVVALGLTHALGDALPDPILLPTIIVLGGLFLGVANSLALAKSGARQILWILAIALAWSVGLTVGLALSDTLGSSWQVAHVVAGLATGVTVSITTAVLFIQSFPLLGRTPHA